MLANTAFSAGTALWQQQLGRMFLLLCWLAGLTT